MSEDVSFAGNTAVSDTQRRKEFANQREQEYRDIVAAFKPVEDCPLVTPFTRFMKVDDETLRHLYKIRQEDPQEEGSFRLPHIPGLNPNLKPRGYQEQMAEHIFKMPRFICGDGVGLGKTISSIVAMVRLRNASKEQGQCHKVIVMTTSSTAYQWESEIQRFSDLKVWVLQDSYKPKDAKKKLTGHAARIYQLEKFLAHPTMTVLVCRYTQWLGIRKAATEDQKTTGYTENGKETLSQEMVDFRSMVGKVSKHRLTLFLDETHRIKTKGGSGRNLIAACHYKFGKVIAMTATPIQNRIDEFYAIASAIGVTPLLSLNYFIERACIVSTSWVRGGRASTTKVTGYRPEAIKKFRAYIRPWFWGRTQAQVKEPMPKLSTVMHPVSLDKTTMKLLLEDIPGGTFQLPPALKQVCGEMVWVERDPSNLMTALSVMSLAANSPALLDPGNLDTFYSTKLSPKEEMFLDLLDNDLEGEYVIGFSKFRNHIDRLEHLTRREGKFTQRQFLRITGNEKGRLREDMRLKFQDPEQPDYNFIMINSAAIEGVNLQRAAHMVCLDLPWSWGALIQLVGRMVRMASPNAACVLHILYALGTVDEYVIDVQKSKKGVFEAILGESATLGLLDDGDIDIEAAIATGLEDESDLEFEHMLRAHAKSIGLRPYAFGDILAKERAGMRDEVNPLAKRKTTVEEEWLSDFPDA